MFGVILVKSRTDVIFSWTGGGGCGDTLKRLFKVYILIKFSYLVKILDFCHNFWVYVLNGP